MTKYRTKIDLLVDYFERAECSREEGEMGIEVEHFVLDKETLKATSYHREEGIEDLLRNLAKGNWEPKLEEDNIVGLKGERARVALEPGGQLELSVLPQSSIEELETIYLDFVKEVSSILDPWDKNLFCLGYQPRSRVDEISFLPKKRYEYMYEYFSDKGKYAYNMMKGTASIHVNFDYFDERDYEKKNLVANILSPLVYTVLDNSPYFEGSVFTRPNLRQLIWENCDADRCGYPVGLFSGQFGYEDYAEYLLNTPPIAYEKEGELVYSKDKLLKDILLEDLNPTSGELDYLLTTVFPDVRTKNHLEIRMGDSLPYPYGFAYLCFWKGLLYSEKNLENLYSRYEGISQEEFLERKRRMTERGVGTGGQSGVFSTYRDLLDLAEQGLKPGEKQYLEPLIVLANEELTPKQKTLNSVSSEKAERLSWCNLSEIINRVG
ncbi:MAG: glutamate--cysteine ligase [Candidatus Bipolaricaulia bacterium]